MPNTTTFNVISLGDIGVTLDPTQGNFISENADDLVGLTFGSALSPLETTQTIQSLSMVSTASDQRYDTDNNVANDTFSIDGGPAQTHDAASIFTVDLQFTDGSTGTATAVIFQDTDGNTYLAPEMLAGNADSTVFQSGDIQSMTVTGVENNEITLFPTRSDEDFASPSFNAISLGNVSDLDTVEGNFPAEMASILVGQTFGGSGTVLERDNLVEFNGVSDLNGNDRLDSNLGPNNADTFSINGGPAVGADTTVIYEATVTLTNGSSQTVTAVLVQDFDGNLYFVPEMSQNQDSAFFESGIIETIEITGVSEDEIILLIDRQEDFAVCFCKSTRIETNQGPLPIEDIRPGTLVRTKLNGFQPVRWIGKTTAKSRAVRIKAGAMGNARDLLVSPRQRMVLGGWQIELLFDHDHALVTALELVNDSTIVREEMADVEYYHIMFDQHEVIYAEGLASESFHPDQPSLGCMEASARNEIFELFPELKTGAIKPQIAPTLPPLHASYVSCQLEHLIAS